MSKKENKNYKIVDGICLYSNEYLMNGDLTESDLDILITNGCLIYSLIINMFRFAGYKEPARDIIHAIKKNNKWLDQCTWTREQFYEYSEIVKKIYYNVYRYQGAELKSYVQWYMIQYGLTVDN